MDLVDRAPAAPGAVTASQALVRNLGSGLRAALFLPSWQRHIVVSWGQFGLLFALAIVSTVLWSLVATGWPARFNFWSLPYAVYFLPLVVLAALALARLGRSMDEVLALLVVTLAASLWIDAFVTVAQVATTSIGVRKVVQWGPWVLFYAGPLWLAAGMAVAAMRRFDLDWLRGVVAVPLAAAIVALPLVTADFASSLWTRVETNPDRAEVASGAVVREDVLYLQPKLLESALAALLPRDARRPNLYLVSVAGYAGQNVFRREVDAVDALFAERFGTRGRSLKLVNNNATVHDTPIATRTALADALKRVGTLMDPAHDVLFLYLTSHGWQDGRFSLSFPPLRLADLTAPDLKTILDDAGIRNRVIVVSSCYSGAFVEALADDNTMILTASARDRNSFGCSNEADFTYFGKAFFDQALRTTDSFSEAFDRALPAIAAREKQEDYEPSGPQRSIGANIEAVLAAWRAGNAAALR